MLAAPPGVRPRSVVVVLPGGGLHFDKRWAARWLPLTDLPVLRAYVDLPLHGERLAADLRERHRHDPLRGFFGPAILGMAEELPSIIDDLLDRVGDPSIDRVGVCGWSIGALAAFLGALEEDRIGVLAGFAMPLGSPDHLRVADRPPAGMEPALLERLDLLAQAGGLYPRPVLLLHGDADTWVGAEASRTLHRALEPIYAPCAEKLRYVEFPGVPHDPLAGDQEQRVAIAEAVRGWLAAHLLAPRETPTAPQRS
ncbi:MAG: hypothetical protein P1P84_21490 [Deferrisomatales bacterium]|nr:hypothetical protein [Deferrisomatales bacterium]